MDATPEDRAGHRLRVVPAPPTRRATVPRDRRAATHEAVMREIARRVARAHAAMRRRGDLLPEALPAERDLTREELEELASRVYALACITRVSLLRCVPTLMLLAAEWLATSESDWDAYCESRLS